MFRLNTQRSFKCPVPIAILDEQGQQHDGQFSAVFRVLDKTEIDSKPNALLLDEVLIEVSELELYRGTQLLQGDALLPAVKADPALASALTAAYWANLVKKPVGKT